jgi:hypothetical protein
LIVLTEGEGYRCFVCPERVDPRASTMTDWFEKLDDRFWLQPDDVGGEEARFILSALRLRRGEAIGVASFFARPAS